MEEVNWIAVLLCAGHSGESEFHLDISKDPSEQYIDLLKTPKALTPVGRVSVADHWIAQFALAGVTQFVVVTNDTYLARFQQWAQERGHPPTCVLSDGTSSQKNRLGPTGDLAFALKLDQIRGKNAFVVAGDTLVYRNFELASFIHQPADVSLMYYPITSQQTSKRGVVDVDEDTGTVKHVLEKPDPTTTSFRFASPAVYAFQSYVCEEIRRYESAHRDSGEPLDDWAPLGKLLSWLVRSPNITVQGVRVSGGIDVSSLSQYQEVNHYFEHTLDAHLNDLALTTNSVVQRTPARIGLMGNPSDGFNGKTCSILLNNFCAEVTIRPSDRLTLVRHPEHDRCEFESLLGYHRYTALNGYYGGMRLLQATCKKFAELCEAANIHPGRLAKNFSMSYDTNIPRMVGLSGSSAIVTAAFKGLMTFYSLSLDDLNIPKAKLPQVILDIEMRELGITAGLQDRVIQVYGGVVHMDFGQQHLRELGHGIYTEYPVSILPPLYLAFNTRAAGDSGKVHSNVRQRWCDGDEIIQTGMATVAGLADKCIDALVNKRFWEIAPLMKENFRNRRLMYGDEVVGARNIEMIELAEMHGMAAKFTGSGGAVVCIRDFSGDTISDPAAYQFTHEEEIAIKERFAAQGFEFMRVDVGEPRSEFARAESANAMVLQID